MNYWTMTMISRVNLLVASAALGLLVGGCDEAEELIDCRQICEAKQDCVDDSYDVDACTTDCEDRSDRDEDFRRDAHECEACIDDRACAEQSACFDTCPILSP